jgi:hypothetical protein
MLRWIFALLLLGLWVWWIIRGDGQLGAYIASGGFVALAFHKAFKKGPMWG